MLRISTSFGAVLLLAASTHPALFSAKAADHWPQWRGPGGDGVAREGRPPAEWTMSDKLQWRVSIPGRGFSTPVVWGDRIFLTTAIPKGGTNAASSEPDSRTGGGAGAGVEQELVVMALDKNTGKTVWRKTATVALPHEGYHRRYGSFASNSPVTDGKTLYAFFGSRGLYAYDLDGNLLWKKTLPMQMVMRLQFGEGTAPVIHDDVILLNCDHEGPSFLLALNRHTGKELWRVDRDEVSTWAPPLVVEYQGRKQVLVSGRTVRSYDFKTGELVWQASGLGTNPIPTPVRHNDLVIFMTGHREPNLLAIQLGGEGDLTNNPDYIKWTNDRGNSYTPSPVLHDGIFYMLTDRGMISALNATTGQPYYLQQRLPGIQTFKASPVAAGGRLYLASEEGNVIVLKLGPEYEVVAVNPMSDESFISSPVVVGDQLFLRSEDELFCIAKK